jgi:hypothetical protein
MIRLGSCWGYHPTWRWTMSTTPLAQSPSSFSSSATAAANNRPSLLLLACTKIESSVQRSRASPSIFAVRRRLWQRPMVRLHALPLPYSSTSCCRRDRDDRIRRSSTNDSTETTTSPSQQPPVVTTTTTTTTTTSSSSDLPIWTWVDQWVPLSAQPYAKLARMDKPIGTMLLVSLLSGQFLHAQTFKSRARPTHRRFHVCCHVCVSRLLVRGSRGH